MTDLAKARREYTDLLKSNKSTDRSIKRAYKKYINAIKFPKSTGGQVIESIYNNG